MNWQPIETAPKDGTPVLLYGDLARPASGTYRGHAIAAWTRYLGDEYFWETDTSGAVQVVSPTHWAALTEP
jgi:hypothetical protein